jgi:uncharacterized protein (DUF58 family)
VRWLIAIAVILLIAFAIQSGLLAYAAYVLLAVFLITRLLTKTGLNVIEAEREVSAEYLDAGQKLDVDVSVRNTGRVPIPWLLLEDLLPEQAIAQRPPRLRVKGKRLQIRVLRGGKATRIHYKLDDLRRGFYQIGPLVLESGDLFGLHRRYRVVAPPAYVMVYPRIVPLRGYDIASRRPIGDVTLAHRLYEDPTRVGGVRFYEAGDPLNRIHWRASARTGRLHSKVYDPSSLTGATLVVDFHRESYPARGEPHRSDLAATAAASLAFAVSELGQQIGLVTNAGDAAERLSATNFPRLLNQDSSDMADQKLAQSVRADAQVAPVERRRILHVPTSRGVDRFEQIRTMLARAELNDGLTLPELLIEAQPRLPRDATVIALTPSVSDQSAIALGNLKRLGYAVSVILVLPTEDDVPTSYGRLAAQGIRDVRPLKNEETLPDICMAEVTRTPVTLV